MAQREPEITVTEKKLFRAILVLSDVSIQDWAILNNYRPQFIRQVLINDRTSNYARLLIRNFIADNSYKLTEILN